MRKLGFIVVALVGLSCRTTETPRPGPGGERPAAVRPTGPGPANLSFTCSKPPAGCDATGFTMEVLGDTAQCAVMGPGSLRLELKSSNDSADGILVAFEGYHGPGSYALNDTARNFIHVNDGVIWNGCDGPTKMGKVVTAGDPSCPSPACTVQVADETPDAPFPRVLTFSVLCQSLCENGQGATCQGPMEFITRVRCG